MAISEAITEATTNIPTIGQGLDICYILSDCKRALILVGNPKWKKNEILKEIFNKLAEAKTRGFTFILRWVPAHEGVQGNERAHTLAQRATETGHVPDKHLLILRHAIRQGRKTLEAKKQWFQAQKTGQFIKKLDQALPGKHPKKLYNGLSRSQAALLAQARSGYCRLNSYLHRISAAESNLCECGALENTRHFLLECVRWSTQRQTFREKVGDRATDLPFILGAYESPQKDGPLEKWTPNTKAVKATIEFIQATGRLDPQKDTNRT